MASQGNQPSAAAGAKLDPKWAKIPLALAVVGGIIGLIGAFTNVRQFGHSYLLAFMFVLSLCLGGLFLTIIHHLFDASWSVPIRRMTEHLAFLLPVMAALFIPIAILAPQIYDWWNHDPHVDHALHAKQPIFTHAGFYVVAIFLFALWTWLSFNLRKWSILQDADGAASHTRKLRVHAAYGIYAFALSLTLGAIMWMKGLEHQWFSTMYGVYYFAESVWTTLAVVYLLSVFMKKQGPLAAVLKPRQFHDIGVLWLAFTVFYAYIHFSQYFLIWNAAIPEETFYYVKREQGAWWGIGMLIVFGHFLLPFLCLLRIDAKLTWPVMVPLAIWALLMHFCDMSWNVMPSLHPEGFTLHWMDLGCLAFVVGVAGTMWLKYFNAHSPYPKKDPRLAEAMGVHQNDLPAAPAHAK